VSDLAAFGTFGDPIVGGVGTLIRDAIHSRDYVPGVSGWSINKDGTCELNGVVIRGSGTFGTPGGQRVEITNTGVIRIYNSSNQLVASLDSSGLLVAEPGSGAYVAVSAAATVAFMYLQPPDVAGHTYTPGILYGYSDSITGSAFSQLESPNTDGGGTGWIRIYGQSPTEGAPYGTTQLYCAVDHIRQNGYSIGGATIASDYSNTDSAAVGAETVVLTVPSTTYLRGHAYRVVVGPAVTSSVNATAVRFRVRKTNAAGALLADTAAINCAIGGTAYECRWSAEFTVGDTADVTAVIVLTLSNLGGPNTATHRAFNADRYIYIQDAGTNAQYPFGNVLS